MSCSAPRQTGPVDSVRGISMIRTTILAGLAATATALAAPTPAPAQDLGEIVGGVAREYLRLEQDRAAFAQAQQAGTLQAYRAYLNQFPQGAHAAEARQQIQRLQGTAAARPADPAPNAPVNPYAGAGADLTRDQRLAVQQRLNALGYATGGIDGSFGPGTRRAIALWQRDRGYEQTGLLSVAQATEILRGTTTTAPAEAPRTGGIMGGTPQAGGTVPLAGAAQDEADLRLTRDQRRAVQAGLTRRGFDTRGVDGVFGRGTRAAIAAWQRANDAPETGYLTAAEAQRLIR